MERTKKQIKTPISYYGGKQALLHHILPMIPAHYVYTEAYFGGGAVFFAKVPAKNETINDKLDIVVNFYECLKFNYKQLKPLIEASLLSRTQHIKAQRMCRNPQAYTKVQVAWAFWLCSNFSFSNKIGGGIKFSNRVDTVPPVTLQHKKEDFTELLVSRIENAHIENTDALTVLQSRNVPEAFHFIDPPYMNADQGHYKGYTEEDFEKQLVWCAHHCNGKFLLTNYNSQLLSSYIKHYGWNTKEVTVRLQARNTNFIPKDKTEVFVWNYNINEGQGNLFNQ